MLPDQHDEGRRLNKTNHAWALDVAIFLIATAGTYVAQWADRPITAVLVYLSGVILIAVHSGLFAALGSAIAASLVYNFFLSEPVFEFGVTTADEAVPLIAFNVTALITGLLVGRLRDSVDRASQAQFKTAFLLTVSDRLQRALKVEEVEAVMRDLLPRQGVRSVKIFLSQGDLFLRPSTGEIVTYPVGQEPMTPASAGKLDPIVLELTGARGVIGIAQFHLAEAGSDRPGVPDLNSISALIALAIERCVLLDEVTEARAQARSEALKDSLLSSVSHDLRTPITVIEAAAGALSSPAIRLPEEERAALLASIIEQCHRLDRYTSELLDVGRIEAGVSPKAMQVVDLGELANLALRQARTLYPDVVFERRLGDGPVVISANPAMVEQAIFNVLDNAGKYGAGAPVSIEVEAVDGVAQLSVTDQGDGIDGPDLKRVFERFYKGSARRASDGSGLGLFIAKGFVEGCGGSISVESPASEGRGARVSLRFPLLQRDERNNEARP